MKIDCVMGTYGRYSLACETLVCFLQQSALSQATLLIYNQHPVPLHFEHPRVRVINEIEPPQALRYLKQRMFELADPTADLIHGLEDDDLIPAMAFGGLPRTYRRQCRVEAGVELDLGGKRQVFAQRQYVRGILGVSLRLSESGTRRYPPDLC